MRLRTRYNVKADNAGEALVSILVCLHCRDEFTWPRITTPKFCPLCGVEFIVDK